MSWIWTGMVLLSVLFSFHAHQGAALAAAALQGAQSAITLGISMTGAVCLWSGVGTLLRHTGVTEKLSGLLHPFLCRVFPDSRSDPVLAGNLSANICANFLGLGNAATPMGIAAAKAMKQGPCASDQLCRLIVLNTASIQLIPANVAAVRSSLGCISPFDILPAVWITSFLSAGLGLTSAWLLGKVWK